jgi:hypothetical protein
LSCSLGMMSSPVADAGSPRKNTPKIGMLGSYADATTESLSPVG